MISQRVLNEIHAGHVTMMGRDHWGSLYEELTLVLYNAVLRHGDVAIDVGANVGIHTAVMARNCGPSGHVFSFEPVPALMEVAKSHCAPFSNISFIMKALDASGIGHEDFYYFPREIGISGLRDRPDVRTECEIIRVEMTTLEKEVTADVSLIKLDIEGAEFSALRGAARVLRESLPIVVFENGRQDAAEKFGYTKEEFFGYFRSVGYNLYTIAGLPFLEEFWLSPFTPWQFIAVHPGNPRSLTALSAIRSILG